MLGISDAAQLQVATAINKEKQCSLPLLPIHTVPIQATKLLLTISDGEATQSPPID
jgi:hypothetical protein